MIIFLDELNCFTLILLYVFYFINLFFNALVLGQEYFLSSIMMNKIYYLFFRFFLQFIKEISFLC